MNAYKYINAKIMLCSLPALVHLQLCWKTKLGEFRMHEQGNSNRRGFRNIAGIICMGQCVGKAQVMNIGVHVD